MSQFRRQKDAEKVRRQVAVDMTDTDVRQELDEIQRRMNVDVYRRKLDEIRRMMNVDRLLSMDDEAQAMEAPFDGENGEACATLTSSADVPDGLEDLWLAELATAESQIEGLQELDFDMQKLIFQKQEQELRFEGIEAKKQERELQYEAKKQEQELRFMEQEFRSKEQELQSKVQEQSFLRGRRDKQLAFMQDSHELYMTQQREQQRDWASRLREVNKYMCANLTQELRGAEAAAVIGKAGKKEAVTQLAASEADADATAATKVATGSEATTEVR